VNAAKIGSESVASTWDQWLSGCFFVSWVVQQTGKNYAPKKYKYYKKF